MIDFRYHIVSLISVFLALAVGIILGAGPLKETIGDQLTGQVDQLREEKESIRGELDTATTDRANLEDYVTASSKRVAKDTLAGRRIAVVQVGDVSDDLFDSVEQEIGYAGGTVTARVAVGDAWVAPDQADARQSYATSLAEYVPDDKKDLQSDKLLAAALVTALSEKSPTNADELSSNAELALEVLDGANLVDLVRYTPEPVDAVIVVDASNVVEDSESEPDFSAASALYMNIPEAAARGTEGVVVTTNKVVDTDLVSTIRENSSVLKLVATVSGVNTPVGRLNTPLALSAAIGGKVGHFGFEASATALVPAAVVLPEPDRTVVGAPDENAENTGNTENAGDVATTDGKKVDGKKSAKNKSTKESTDSTGDVGASN